MSLSQIYNVVCPEEVVVGSAAWLAECLSCDDARNRDTDSRLPFDLITPAEVYALVKFCRSCWIEMRLAYYNIIIQCENCC